MGEELDVADLAVLATAKKFEIFVAHDWANSEALPFRRLREYIVEMQPGCEAAFGDDNQDALSWVVILCNARFDPFGDTNHFVPAFPAEELGDEQFEQLRGVSLAETDARIEQLRVGCEMDVETEEDLMLRHDYEMTWEHMKAWKLFQERCYKSKLHPVEVLGDGNCLLWSLKCLKDDDIRGKKTMTPEKADYKILQAWRRDLHDQWIALSKNEDWQMLFNHIYVDSDVPLRHETSDQTEGRQANDVPKIKKEPCRSPSPKKGGKSKKSAAPESDQPSAESEGNAMKRCKSEKSAAPERDQLPKVSEGDPEKKHKRVASCRPASCFESGPSQSAKLHHPKKKVKDAKEDAKKDHKKDAKGNSKKRSKEDDRNQKKSKKNQEPAESAQEAEEDVEVPEVSETETVVAEPTRTRVRKKVRTTREIRLRALRAYLGELGAASCSEGNYTSLQQKLLADPRKIDELKCDACKSLLLKCNFSSAEAIERMRAAEAGEVDSDCADAEEAEMKAEKKAEMKAADEANSHASQNPGSPHAEGNGGDADDYQADGGLQYLGLETIAKIVCPYFEAGLGCAPPVSMI
eukprot:s553_g19.t1